MRGDKFLRVIVIVLLCVVTSYVVFSVVRAPDSTYTTYKAVLYEVGGYTTSGFVVRSEQLVPGGQDGIVVLTRKEGERVSKGGVVASTFWDESAKTRQNEIHTLETELDQMEYAYSYSSSGQDSATLDNEILHLMNQVTLYNFRREADFADSAAEQLKASVLRRYVNSEDSKNLWNRISQTRTRLNELYTQVQSESGTVLAQTAGYFSAVTDGYESVLTPAMLETVSVGLFRELQPNPAAASGAIGKLVTSPRWYYAALVDPAKLGRLEVGDRLDVRFVYDFYSTIRMEVVRISPSEDGQCLLVLSSEDFVQDAVSTRKQSADLLLEDRTGLLVPKAAIYADENGRSGVYVLDGAEARWKYVDIINDNGEQYLVALDKSSIRNLWPEDEVILTKEEMFNGKVMVR